MYVFKLFVDFVSFCVGGNYLLSVEDAFEVL